MLRTGRSPQHRGALAGRAWRLRAVAAMLGGKSPAMGGGRGERGAAIGSSFHATLSS